MQEWKLSSTIEQSIRHVNQLASGGSYVAIFTLRLEPSDRGDRVEFENLMEDSIPKEEYEPHIEAGIQEFIQAKAAEDIKISCLKISLIEHLFHEVDSKPHAYKSAAKMAMADAFKKHIANNP